MPVLRAKFSKLESVRFISHLDLIRTFERAMRRAGVPMAQSEGYHPRPKFSFASALSVGVTSESEYADFELSEEWSPDTFQTEVNRQLPSGLVIQQAASISDSAPKLMAVVDRATYCCTAANPNGSAPMDGDALNHRVDELLAQDNLVVQRTRKGKTRDVDIRPLIYGVSLEALSPVAARLDVATGSKGNVRPEEVLGLLPVPVEIWRIHRTGLFITVDGEPKNPMEVGV